MADLRDALSGMGLEQLLTYIQSGNVVFRSKKTESELQKMMQKAILDRFGFEVPTIIKTSKNLQRIFDNCPYPQDKKEESYFIMLDSEPLKENIEKAQKIQYENEEVIIKNDALYYHSAAGYGKSKFNMNTFEQKLQVSGTARNFKTMVKLLSLAEDLN